MATAHARFDAFAMHGETAVDTVAALAGTARKDVAPTTPSPAPSSSPARVVRASVGADGAAVRPLPAAPLNFAGHRTRRCARRWEGFLALAESRGVSADEVADRFTADDIADLCASEHDDVMLGRCMDTLAETVRRERDSLLREPPFGESASDGSSSCGEPESTGNAMPQARCGGCLHFRRRASHPHLGDCAGGVPRTAAGGFWDDQVRGCETFVPA